MDVHFTLPDIGKGNEAMAPAVDLDRYLNRVLQTKDGISLLKSKMSRKPLDLGIDATVRDP